jgi:integrase
LEEVLRAYVFNPDRPPTTVLFPRYLAGREAMLTDFRKVVNRVSVPAGWEPGAITSKMFRHTYASSRLQTVDRGAPVALWTVEQEMGHGSADMIREVYGHLGSTRHRAEVVEYRVEQHGDALRDRLQGLRRRFSEPSGTTSDTAPSEVT